MRKGQYIVLKVADIQYEIKELEDMHNMRSEARVLRNLLENNPKDLYDVVGDAYDKGEYAGEWVDEKFDFRKNYLNSLEI